MTKRRFTKAEREQRDERFWERVWEEHRALRLPPWTMVTPLFTQGLRCPADHRDKDEWERAAAEFRRILAKNPNFYDDCLP
jgi:hypothetical protein